jgi:hypothetical protein
MNEKWPEKASDAGAKQPESHQNPAADVHACDSLMKIGTSSDLP